MLFFWCFTLVIRGTLCGVWGFPTVVVGACLIVLTVLVVLNALYMTNKDLDRRMIAQIKNNARKEEKDFKKGDMILRGANGNNSVMNLQEFSEQFELVESKASSDGFQEYCATGKVFAHKLSEEEALIHPWRGSSYARGGSWQPRLATFSFHHFLGAAYCTA